MHVGASHVVACAISRKTSAQAFTISSPAYVDTSTLRVECQARNRPHDLGSRYALRSRTYPYESIALCAPRKPETTTLKAELTETPPMSKGVGVHRASPLHDSKRLQASTCELFLGGANVPLYSVRRLGIVRAAPQRNKPQPIKQFPRIHPRNQYGKRALLSPITMAALSMRNAMLSPITSMHVSRLCVRM
jgi:hypothetical protein